MKYFSIDAMRVTVLKFQYKFDWQTILVYNSLKKQKIKEKKLNNIVFTI